VGFGVFLTRDFKCENQRLELVDGDVVVSACLHVLLRGSPPGTPASSHCPESMHVREIGDCKVSQGVSVSVDGCVWPCDGLVTRPGCTLPLTQ